MSPPHEPTFPPYASLLLEQHCDECERETVWFDPKRLGAWECSGQTSDELGITPPGDLGF